ncbi:MAG: hypothetical protein CMF89_03615 [Candidatus Marinimicrobia bacterium]|nr:hypothetical protein [Candidatus Neomarinimicrobiota bacterium]
MTMKLSYITFSIFFSTLMYAECGNYDFEECLINTDCYWEENLQSYNCSQFNSSDQCNSYSEYGCYTSWNSTNWEDDCEGGQFTIDYGYCLENAMPECSNLNQLECINNDVCQWINDIEIGNCSDITNSFECYQAQCLWYNAGNYGYLYDNCYGGTYQIDNSYCQDNSIFFGDINNDSLVNILDVIQTVNLILYNEYNFVVDINQDDIINIQDVILIISLIL